MTSFRAWPSAAARPRERLSGGEQQMLAIGRALMSRPKLMMFDEPSLGLAPNIVEQAFAIIRGIREAGTTVLMVEQNASPRSNVRLCLSAGSGSHRAVGSRQPK